MHNLHREKCISVEFYRLTLSIYSCLTQEIGYSQLVDIFFPFLSTSQTLCSSHPHPRLPGFLFVLSTPPPPPDFWAFCLFCFETAVHCVIPTGLELTLLTLLGLKLIETFLPLPPDFWPQIPPCNYHSFWSFVSGSNTIHRPLLAYFAGHAWYPLPRRYKTRLPPSYFNSCQCGA